MKKITITKHIEDLHYVHIMERTPIKTGYPIGKVEEARKRIKQYRHKDQFTGINFDKIPDEEMDYHNRLMFLIHKVIDNEWTVNMKIIYYKQQIKNVTKSKHYSKEYKKFLTSKLQSRLLFILTKGQLF